MTETLSKLGNSQISISNFSGKQICKDRPLQAALGSYNAKALDPIHFAIDSFSIIELSNSNSGLWEEVIDSNIKGKMIIFVDPRQ